MIIVLWMIGREKIALLARIYYDYANMGSMSGYV
jgi:hypothetical protein